MKIFIEGERYSIDILKANFDDAKFYKQIGVEGIITSVGYYRSSDKNNLVFLLPKVFMADSVVTVFGATKNEIIDLNIEKSSIHDEHLNWLRQLSVFFYNSLIEFRKRRYNTSILHLIDNFELATNIPENELSYMDLYLSCINFYKKNHSILLFKSFEYRSSQSKKTKWEKTIRKSLPQITNGSPIYYQLRNQRKTPDKEEELITYFLSIINHFNEKHHVNLKIDKAYPLITGKSFQTLCSVGGRKLKRIKYRYFNDVLKRMYRLCEIFFSYMNSGMVVKKQDEFLATTNYNIVFEDMIDKLFTQERLNLETNDGISIEKLKNNADGKIIDHIYEYKSLIDVSNIFYIGDSKYYKSGHSAGSVPKYKQHTYAKNVIQFNINLLNEGKSYGKIRYRDELTEGYNITPNFFLYGYISDVANFSEHQIETINEVECSSHYPNRLFDRDTLFIHQYKINFLFVLKAYTASNKKDLNEFQNQVKELFRANFIDFFSNKNKCGFEFYKFVSIKNKHDFISTNFRQLIGKCYNTIDGTLLLAKHFSDHLISSNILNEFKKVDSFNDL
ncbi:hypothetical protein ACTHQF_06040 [Pedobacter sp. SAFR-022]|uniref:hypothetical protein n=1 Tax=Pedobacter sp. SAFR-022 TaxID=3436861 RepID=UPI003F7E1E58